MSTPTREEFEARIEAVEARMDARVAAIGARLDEYTARADERMQGFLAMSAERDKRVDERFAERDKRVDECFAERDKRFDLLVQRVDAALERTSHLTTHVWLATLTVILAVAGTVVGAYYATQSSHIGVTQAVISAFQQGQQMQSTLKE